MCKPLMSGSWKGEKNKGTKGRGRSSIPVNALDITPARGKRTCKNEGRCNNNGCPHLCLQLCDTTQQSVKRTQVPNIGRTRSFLSTLAPKSDGQDATRTYVCHVAMGSQYCSKCLSRPKLTSIYCLSLSLKVSSL